MAYYAAAVIDDAIDATRARLFPFSGWLWMRLAVIVLFLGGGGFSGQFSNVPGSIPTGPGDGPTPPGGGPTDPGVVDPGIGVGVILVIAVIVLLLVVVFALIGTTMQFVFVDALSVEEQSAVRVIGPFFDRLGAGVRLFLFNVGLFLLVAIPIAAVVAVAVGVFSVGSGDAAAGAGVAVLLIGAVLLVGLLLLVGIVSSLTTQFVVPVMIATNGTVLGSWRRLYPRLRGEVGQTVVYVVVRFLLGLGVGIVNALLIAVGLIPVGLVAGIVAALVGGLAFVAAGESAAVLAGGLVGGLVGLLGLLVVFLGVSVLTKMYLRTYELAVLERFDAAFALLPDYDERDEGGDGDSDGPGNADGSGDADGPDDSDGPGNADGRGAGTETTDDADDEWQFPADEDSPDTATVGSASSRRTGRRVGRPVEPTDGK